MQKSYKEEVEDFLDNPFWLRPIEINLVNTIREYNEEVILESNIRVKDYLNRLYKLNEDSLKEFASEVFLNSMKKLL